MGNSNAQCKKKGRHKSTDRNHVCYPDGEMANRPDIGLPASTRNTLSVSVANEKFISKEPDSTHTNKLPVVLDLAAVLPNQPNCGPCVQNAVNRGYKYEVPCTFDCDEPQMMRTQYSSYCEELSKEEIQFGHFEDKEEEICTSDTASCLSDAQHEVPVDGCSEVQVDGMTSEHGEVGQSNSSNMSGTGENTIPVAHSDPACIHVHREELDCLPPLSALDRVKLHLQNLRQDNMVCYQEIKAVLEIVRKSTKSEQSEISQFLFRESVLNICEIFLEKHTVSCMLKRDDCEFVTNVWPTLKMFTMLFWILCDACVNFCQYLISSKFFIFLLSELRYMSQLVNTSQPVWEVFFVKSILGILHNISRHVPNSKWNLRNEGVVAVLQMFLSSEIPMIRVKALIILSYIISEAENEVVNSKDGNINFILQVLSDALSSPNHMSTKYGMSAAEILKGLNNLAINDENKIRIVQNGALELYEQCLADGTIEEKKLTIVTLWSLAFHHYNKRKMSGMPGIMDRLHELQQGDDEEVCHAARGTVWELDNMSKTKIGGSYSSSSSTEKHNASQPHIMISYQWDSQPIVIKVKDRLKHAGYKVWMDVEHMTGSTLEAMALAVEQAAVVLVCMSQRYKDSPNCRTEAEYVYRLRKDFVPLRLQDQYIPDGWLGILVGTRLYFDLYVEDAIDAQIPRIIKELRDRGKISPLTDHTDAGPVAVPSRCGSRDVAPILDNGTTTEVRDWSHDDIGHWLASLSAGSLNAKLPAMDGSLLLELQQVQATAPQCFYAMLKSDFGMSAVEMLTFSKLLRTLR